MCFIIKFNNNIGSIEIDLGKFGERYSSLSELYNECEKYRKEYGNLVKSIELVLDDEFRSTNE